MPVKDFILLVVYLLVPLACDFTERWTPFHYFVEHILVSAYG